MGSLFAQGAVPFFTVPSSTVCPVSRTISLPVAGVLGNEIMQYRKERQKNGLDTSPDAFMFGGRFGMPMDSSNYRKRVLHKLADDLDLPKLNFQVIRRTIATLGKSKGHVKDIQGIMRHSKASTTTDVYMQSLEPEVRTAVNMIYDELLGDPFFGSGDGTVSGLQPKPSNPSGGTSTREVASPALNQADDTLLRSLGVRWEPDAAGAED